MNRYRLTIYFVLTALLSITVALLVVNQVIGKITEENLTWMAEKNAVRNSIHMQAMLRGSASGMHHTGMQMADMSAEGMITEDAGRGDDDGGYATQRHANGRYAG